MEIKSKGGEELGDDVLPAAFAAARRVATIAMIRVRNIVVIPFSFVYTDVSRGHLGAALMGCSLFFPFR